MFIQTEETPNPQTLKFLPERQVLDSVSGVRSLEFKKNQDTSSCPLAKRLLLVDYRFRSAGVIDLKISS